MDSDFITALAVVAVVVVLILCQEVFRSNRFVIYSINAKDSRDADRLAKMLKKHNHDVATCCDGSVRVLHEVSDEHDASNTKILIESVIGPYYEVSYGRLSDERPSKLCQEE